MLPVFAAASVSATRVPDLLFACSFASPVMQRSACRVMASPETPPLTRARAASLALQYGLAAAEEDIEARLLALGFAVEVAQAVLHGDRRPFDEIAKDLAKVAA